MSHDLLWQSCMNGHPMDALPTKEETPSPPFVDLISHVLTSITERDLGMEVLGLGKNAKGSAMLTPEEVYRVLHPLRSVLASLKSVAHSYRYFYALIRPFLLQSLEGDRCFFAIFNSQAEAMAALRATAKSKRVKLVKFQDSSRTGAQKKFNMKVTHWRGLIGALYAYVRTRIADSDPTSPDPGRLFSTSGSEVQLLLKYNLDIWISIRIYST